MPTVGKKKFAYNKKGEAEAVAYAEKTGKKLHYNEQKTKPKKHKSA